MVLVMVPAEMRAISSASRPAGTSSTGEGRVFSTQSAALFASAAAATDSK